MNQKEHFGYDSLNRLADELVGHKNIFLVTGKKSFEDSGAKDAVMPFLEGRSYTWFSEFQQNPKYEEALKGICLLGGQSYDVIVAIGGGSVIDMAKLLRVLSVQPTNSLPYVTGEKKLERRGLPLIAIPTTSGSGSETTHFAVVYWKGRKYSLSHKFVLPEVSIVDPKLTLTMTPYQTATSGMDALCQAIESYWASGSTEESQRYASEAIKLAVHNLPLAVKRPDNHSRLAMAKASHLAGKAINISKTTGPHAMSYIFTSQFGIPHGHAAALTLREFLSYNAGATEEDVCDSRGAVYVRENMERLCRLIGAENAKGANNVLKNLMREAGLKTRLGELEIELYKDNMDLIVGSVNAERLKNNPRMVTKEVLVGMLRSIA